MRAQEVLRPELIKVPLEAEGKLEAISELIDLLVQYHEVPMSKRHSLVEEFQSNAWSIGTGLERGMAFPHISTDRVDDFICAIGVSAKGVNFASLDDQPAHVIVLAIAPKKGLGQEIEILADIERFLETDDTVGKLVRARSSQEAFDIFGALEVAGV